MWRKVRVRENMSHRGVWIKLSWWPSPSNQSVVGKLAHLLEWFPQWGILNVFLVWAFGQNMRGWKQREKKVGKIIMGNSSSTSQWSRRPSVAGLVVQQRAGRGGPSTEGSSRGASRFAEEDRQDSRCSLLPSCLSLSQLPPASAPKPEGTERRSGEAAPNI